MLANSLWLASLLADASAFHRAVWHTQKTQAALLRTLLQRHQTSQYGRRFGFGKLTTVADFQAALPLTTYEDYAPYIERIAAGEAQVLTAEPVTLLEPTSGSSSASKLIPYTRSLKRAFQRGIAPWVCDLFGRDPQLVAGQAYWSISPVMARRVTPAGIPIGFEDDSGYLGAAGRWLKRAVICVPSVVRFARDIETFRYLTLFYLLRAANLRLISVWNPTFLSLLLAPLTDWGEQLAGDIARGRLSIALEPALRRGLESSLTPRPKRGKDLANALQHPQPLTRLWPNLGLISCWMAASAAPFASVLAQQFPGVTMQGKGLIATEALVSLPLTQLPAPALAIRSHVFEFLDEAGRVYLAHELVAGKRYRVIVTTDGLYRYQLNDYVKVAGFYGECPLIDFVGKGELVSDHFGEKLHQHFVQTCLDATLGALGIRARFTLLSCEAFAEGYAYTLFIESASPLQDSVIAQLAIRLEAALSQNIHYAYCRKLGQLAVARVVAVQNGAAWYLEHEMRSGKRLGDIKPQVLSPRMGYLDVWV
jgi:hypothetical protein